MQEQRVTKAQAIRLKKVGYPTQHPFHVDINGNPFPEPEQIEITLSQCCNWLREVKGWHVYAEPLWDGRKHWEGYATALPTFNKITTKKFATHDAAISAGIDAVLEQIEKESTLSNPEIP